MRNRQGRWIRISGLDIDGDEYLQEMGYSSIERFPCVGGTGTYQKPIILSTANHQLE